MTRKRLSYFLLALLATMSFAATADAKWWNSDWTIRKKLVIDTTAKGTSITQPIESAAILIRLHDGNFQFGAAKEDGSDLRFLAADEKTILTYHIEKFDSLLGEAFVWVKVPGLKPDAVTNISLYYGNTGGTAVKAENAKGTFDADTVLVYHFAERGGAPTDSSAGGNNGQGEGVPADGSMIGTGLRLTGRATITIPGSPSLAWADGGAMTLGVWVKPAALQANAVIYSRKEEGKTFTVGMDQGIPILEINGQRTGAGTPVAVDTWHRLTVTAAQGKATLYLDGESYGAIDAPLPGLTAAALLGGSSPEAADGFVGELDELELSKVARAADFINLRTVNQGGDKANKLMNIGTDEQHTTWFSGGGTLSVLVSSLTVDGWLVIIVLALMACMSWWVMVTKIRYLNMISKGNAVFMREWKRVAEDLTVLYAGGEEDFRSMGGQVDQAGQRAMRNASVYHIYHLGVEEIRHRIASDNAAEGTRKGLAGRSIQAIRATLDGGLVRETQKINRLIVLLTICISGGPFLGLLGTVIGVMITFAAIAAAGDVNVNAIAPGIAAALLATVAGLAVAIPALFGYNYIISRVKDAKDDMAIFIDEFVTKMAEFYRETPGPYLNRSDLVEQSSH